jgi:FKBP-type peptidyl-prolyl cis-trans isomerase 2
MRTPRQQTALFATVGVLLIGMTFLSHPSQATVENAQITDGSNVTFQYKITVPGRIGLSVQDVAVFIQGKHQVLPAVERAVTGMKEGDVKQIELSAEEGFGPYDDKKKKHVPRVDLPLGVKEGDILEDWGGTPVIVAQLSETAAILDYNHPLAGKTLVVHIKILKVENPS